ncbi:2Fe-2S iron-sulfur cluster-binding protein [Sphingomonas sp. MS122]|uniref:2Fe-2S iron-sulfur cluster-binding protein n=1 Tax=Sphingomonas sp. MS122 TaxID=3412683 RepID=UPI003C2C621F
MIRLTIETPNGETRAIEVMPEGSLMEAIRDNGFDDLLASCGGCCSCATCHIIVDARYSGSLAAMSPDEDALLDGSDHREEHSRLSCQIALGNELDGLKLRIAPSD